MDNTWHTIWLVKTYDEDDFLLDAMLVYDRTEYDAHREAEAFAESTDCADWTMIDLGDITGYRGQYKPQ